MFEHNGLDIGVFSKRITNRLGRSAIDDAIGDEMIALGDKGERRVSVAHAACKQHSEKNSRENGELIFHVGRSSRK